MKIGRKANVAAVLAMIPAAFAACAADEPAGEDVPEAPPEPAMAVRITEPADGAVVSSPFRVVFEVEGLEVVPAGEDRPRSGHHHLLIDVDEPAPGTPVPSIDGYMHFGQAQTEVEVDLEPGEHRLIAVVGDFAHIPLVPNVTDTITVTVRQ